MPGNDSQRLERGLEHPLDHAGCRGREAIRISAAGRRIRAEGEEDELSVLARARHLEGVLPARLHQAVGLTPNHVDNERIELG